MAAKIFRINYKSDFILTLNSDAGWMTPFCIKFWTGAPSQAFFVGWDGETYTHCSYDPSEPTKLLVQFDDHHLPIGDLKFQVAYHFTVADFPNDTEDEVINTANITTEIDGETYQVMLDFTGETAPEIEFSLPAYANEAQRIANEQQRIANEEQRISNEQARIDNEALRISAEQTRQNNEDQRIRNEQTRINQEEARVREFATLKRDAQEATAAANDAAALANQKAQLAADKAQLAQDKADLAQAAANLANQKAQLAADKAALANDAAALANQKAQLAQQKAEYAQTQGDYAKQKGDYAKEQGDYAKRKGDDAAAQMQQQAQAFNEAQAARQTAYEQAEGTESGSVAGDGSRWGAFKTNEAARDAKVDAKVADITNLQEAVAEGAVYDVSAKNPTAGPNNDGKWESLSALLSDANLNTLIPTSVRKGGMSIKFVQSSDNKYIQYMYKQTSAATTSVFTNVANWERMNLEEKISIFVPDKNVDFTDDVLELLLIKTPGLEVKLQSYLNNVYIICTGSATYAKSDVVSENNIPYPIKVYSGATAEFPNGTIVGYIMLRDVASFKSKSSSNKQIINAERCFNLANSPLIASSLGKIVVDAGKIGGKALSVIFEQNGTTVKNATNATNATSSDSSPKATNATNVVEASVVHSSFVKELYLFGDDVDKTKTYKISAVARNHTQYKYSIVINDGTTEVAYLQAYPTKPVNPVLIPKTSANRDIQAYAIVNWDDFADGSNQSTNITLLPRVFDINYSPNIANYLISKENKENVEKQGEEIHGLELAVDSLYGEVNYVRADFKDSYLNTYGKNIGDTSSDLPSDTTPVSPSSDAGHLKLQVKKGDKVIAKFKTSSNVSCRAWVFLDTSNKVIAWSDPQSSSGSSKVYDYLTEPFVFYAEKDGLLYIHFTKAYYDANENLLIEYHYIKGEEPESIADVEVCLPNTIYAVVGDTLQLYYRAIFRCVDYSKYDVNVVCDIGAQYPRYFEVTPLVGNIGSHTLTFSIRDNNNFTLGTKTINLVVVATGTSPANELNILCLGASATENGQWASEFKRRLVGTGGTPIGSGKTNIQFVGRKNVTFDGKQVNLEATGGYTFGSYTNTTTARYRFNVTAENEPTIREGDVYSNNGWEFTIVEINIDTGHGGYFSCDCDKLASPNYSGTLTKVSGTGSDSIVYASSRFTGNPFVYNDVIDMQQYADDYCNPQEAAHGRIDVVYTELFGNSTSVYTEDFTTRMSQMQTFITQVRNVFPNCKFCIGLFWNPDIRGGMGVNYGATGGWSDPYGIKYSNMNLCNALQKYITDNSLSDYVFILNWLNEFDEENDMQQTTKKVNPRSNVTEIFGVNGVHPATVGYYQMADTAWRLFVAKFCQST